MTLIQHDIRIVEQILLFKEHIQYCNNNLTNTFVYRTYLYSTVTATIIENYETHTEAYDKDDVSRHIVGVRCK